MNNKESKTEEDTESEITEQPKETISKEEDLKIF